MSDDENMKAKKVYSIDEKVQYMNTTNSDVPTSVPSFYLAIDRMNE